MKYMCLTQARDNTELNEVFQVYALDVTLITHIITDACTNDHYVKPVQHSKTVRLEALTISLIGC